MHSLSMLEKDRARDVCVCREGRERETGREGQRERVKKGGKYFQSTETPSLRKGEIYLKISVCRLNHLPMRIYATLAIVRQ